MASEAMQKAAKCIIGKDYSLPMINHIVASRTNMERMKQVYQQLAKYRQGKANSIFSRMSAHKIAFHSDKSRCRRIGHSKHAGKSTSVSTGHVGVYKQQPVANDNPQIGQQFRQLRLLVDSFQSD